MAASALTTPGKTYPPGKWYSVQPASRVEDYNRGSETGVLAYFHLLSLYNSENTTFDGLLRQMLAYLTKDCRLDPTRIVLTSTSLFKPYLETLTDYGMKKTQFIERDLDEAKELGDGSGYFNPKGVPHLNGGYPTAAFDYMLAPGHIDQRHDLSVEGQLGTRRNQTGRRSEKDDQPAIWWLRPRTHPACHGQTRNNLRGRVAGPR